MEKIGDLEVLYCAPKGEKKPWSLVCAADVEERPPSKRAKPRYSTKEWFDRRRKIAFIGNVGKYDAYWDKGELSLYVIHPRIDSTCGIYHRSELPVVWRDMSLEDMLDTDMGPVNVAFELSLRWSKDNG
tara:strand:- start:31 stop:417 length:387 start_codon:yes stop_codon:yes gene_type:complete